MMSIPIDDLFLGIMSLSFIVNIVVQLTKDYIPIPTKLWCILVSIALDMAIILVGVDLNFIPMTSTAFIIAISVAFITAYIAMYGFDTFKDIWAKFKKGENINEDK